jgi:hypothetical protein
MLCPEAFLMSTTTGFGAGFAAPVGAVPENIVAAAHARIAGSFMEASFRY